MKRSFLGLLALTLVTACVHTEPEPTGPEPSLEFRHQGRVVAHFTRSELKTLTPELRVEAFDPYYQRTKRWRAVELIAVLRAAFPGVAWEREELVLRASDGYTVPISGGRLIEPGAAIAFADADGPWEPIGPTRANPAPFYVVWKEAQQQDLETHPRPWSLASISIEPFAQVFPKVVPPGGSDARVQQGFAVWRTHCFKCHALNQQGGRVGPELNAPMNVTEYRDDAFLKRWIRDPQRFRPSLMPSFAGFSDEELESVLAYLRAMKGTR